MLHLSSAGALVAKSISKPQENQTDQYDQHTTVTLGWEIGHL